MTASKAFTKGMGVKKLAVLLLAVVGLTLFTPDASGGTPDEDYLFGRINQQRTGTGTGTLSFTTDRTAEVRSAESDGREQRRRKRRRRRRPPSVGTAGALVEHPAILAEVRAHAEDMARRGELDHAGFDQRVARIRAADAGISGFICENVGFVSGVTGQAALDRIVQGWLNSPPHRACMLDENAKTQSAAVGIFRTGDETWAAFITAADSTL